VVADLAPVSRDRSSTNPTITVVTDDGETEQVQLRKPSDSDENTTDRRKSGELTVTVHLAHCVIILLAPPKVQEKNVRTFVNPEKLTFQERVAYHKRMMTDAQQPHSTSKSSLDSQTEST